MPNNPQHIVVIGAANADITGISDEPLRYSESNPGRMTLGAGGVGRNIADNFARLAADDAVTTYLLSVIGDDVHGKMVQEQSLQAGIDMSHCQVVAGGQTASYFCIIDYNGEMRSAISDMSIVEQINVNYLSANAELINSAELIVLDANLSQQAIDFVCMNFNHIPIFVDSVSAVKAVKITPHIKHIYCLTPNLNEAEILSKIQLRNDDDLARVAEFFHHKGMGHLFITLGSKGLYVSAPVEGQITIDYLPALEGEIVNTNGAGDAFMAGLIYAHLKSMDTIEQANFAQSCAFLNCQSEHTVNQNLSLQGVMKIMEST